jgi:HAD superfamily hydrolase (TIGR01509 family)
MILPRAPKAVIFDLDGLLIDSETLFFDAMTVVAPRFGVVMDMSRFRTLVGLPRLAHNQKLIEHYGADFPVQDFTAAVYAHINEGREAVAALKGGVNELLDALEASAVSRALCTSSGRPWVDRHFEAHALAARFNAVITRGDYVNGKPSPEPYLKAAAALGVDPLDCLALEDSHNGVRAAHAAGMMTVMIPDMLEPDAEMQAKTIHIARSLHEVAALFSAP